MSQNTISVLLIDDEYVVRQVFSALLQSAGYRVQVAENGVAALKCLREYVPHVILSDLDMPEMSGFELLSVIRRRFSSVKVVAMSGAYVSDGIPAGLCADAFFPKGVHSPGVLLQILKNVLTQERSDVVLKQISESPVWTAKILYGTSDEPSIILTCPDCMRSYPHAFSETNVMLPQQSDCICCGNRINYSVISTDFAAVRPQKQAALDRVVVNNPTWSLIKLVPETRYPHEGS